MTDDQVCNIGHMAGFIVLTDWPWMALATPRVLPFTGAQFASSSDPLNITACDWCSYRCHPDV